ncbi:MAG: hypothetical protein ACTSQ8_25655 [Candidatus Helarchaeota archaeon]
MNEKDDGRLYSRIMRRSIVIINLLDLDQVYTLDEIAGRVHKEAPKEFYLERFKRQMSISRTKDYVRYLFDLQVIDRKDDKYILNFQHRTNDDDWAQSLSDLAFPHLAKLLKITPPEVNQFLTRVRNQSHSEKKLPTLDKIIEQTDISSNREQEYFKWSLYIYADVDTCPFDIRRYPSLVLRGD